MHDPKEMLYYAKKELRELTAGVKLADLDRERGRAWKARVDELEDRIYQLENILTVFQCRTSTGGGPTARLAELERIADHYRHLATNAVDPRVRKEASATARNAHDELERVKKALAVILPQRVPKKTQGRRKNS